MRRSSLAGSTRPALLRSPGTAAGRSATLALCVLVLAAAGACGGAIEGDADAIRALVEKETAAINARDLNGLAGIWSEAPEILLFDVPPPGRFRGWGEVARVFRDFFDRFAEIKLTVASLEVAVEGDLAYASYDWTLTGMMGEQAVSDRGQATSIYRREESGWRLIHAHFSPVPAAVALESAGEAEEEPAGEAGTTEEKREPDPAPSESPAPS
jgi:uncharacterized protein (TIGR02246 family)